MLRRGVGRVGRYGSMLMYCFLYTVVERGNVENLLIVAATLVIDQRSLMFYTPAQKVVRKQGH